MNKVILVGSLVAPTRKGSTNGTGIFLDAWNVGIPLGDADYDVNNHVGSGLFNLQPRRL